MPFKFFGYGIWGVIGLAIGLALIYKAEPENAGGIGLMLLLGAMAAVVLRALWGLATRRFGGQDD